MVGITREGRRVVGAALLLSFFPGSLARSSERLRLEVGSERSFVSLEGVDSEWSVDRVELGYFSPEGGGGFLSVERHGRFQKNDVVFSGTGYRRRGDWTFSGRAAVTPGADFYYRFGAEAEVARRLTGSFVGQVGYRYLNFAATTVHIVTPAATYYARRGEIEARGFVGRTSRLGLRARSVLVKSSWRVHRVLRFGSGLAYGNGIFDVTSLAGPAPRGWVFYVNPEMGIATRNWVGVVGSLSHEAPAFDRRSLGFYYRRAF